MYLTPQVSSAVFDKTLKLIQALRGQKSPSDPAFTLYSQTQLVSGQGTLAQGSMSSRQPAEGQQRGRYSTAK